MIKTIKTKQFKILAAVLALVLTVSCITWNATRVHAQELEIGNANVTGYALTTGGTDGNMILSGHMTTLGLFVENDNDKYKANHEQYVCGQDGKWYFDSSSSNSDTTQMLFNGTGFDYVAYSPYMIGNSVSSTYLYNSTTFSVPTDGEYGGGSASYETATTVSGSQYDLLWSKGTSDSANLNPTLQHVLSMITVNITDLGSEVDGAPTIESIKIGGTVVTGNLNLTGATKASEVVTVKDGEAATDMTAMQLATPNSIDPTDTSKGQYFASFEALIIPQTATLEITVTLSNGQVFTSTVNSHEFVSGTAYNISLQVGQDKVTLGAITAAPWSTPVNGGDLETE